MKTWKRNKLLTILDRVEKTNDNDIKTFSKVFRDALIDGYYNDPVREESSLKVIIIALAGICIILIGYLIFK
jgi:hypothetical protein